MKNRQFLLLGLLLVFGLMAAACTGGGAAVQDAIEQAAPTLEAAAQELAPTVQAAVEEVAPTVQAAIEEAVPRQKRQWPKPRPRKPWKSQWAT